MASIPHKNSGEESKLETQDISQSKNHDFSEGNTFIAGEEKGTSIIASKIQNPVTYILISFPNFGSQTYCIRKF